MTTCMRSLAITCLMLLGSSSVEAGPITIFNDEGSFMAAAGNVTMESFENILLGTVSNSFALPTFTVTADRSLQVLGPSISPYTGHDGLQALINYDFTGAGQSPVTSTDFLFTLNAPTYAFGVWVFDWGTNGSDGTTFVWSTDAGVNPGVVATRPNEPCDTTGTPADCWQFIGFVSTLAFTQVHMADPNGADDGYMFDQVYTQATPVPEPSTLLLLGTGLAGMITASRRRRTSQNVIVSSLCGQPSLEGLSRRT